MKTWTKISAGAGAVVLAMAGLAFAQTAAPATGAAGHKLGESPLGRLVSGVLGRGKALKEELNLSAEQRGQIKEILKAHKDEITAAAKEVVGKRRALRDAVTAGAPEESAIRTAATDLGKAVGDAAVLAAKIRGEVAKVLTPEQMEKIKKFRADNDQAVDGWLKDLGKDL